MPGAEGDGTTNVFDAAHGWMFHQKKKDFIGKRSVERDLKLGGSRKQLVGLLMEDSSFVPPDGSPIVEGWRKWCTGQVMIGHITAGTFSPNLERSLALALLFEGHDRKGETSNDLACGPDRGRRRNRPDFHRPQGRKNAELRLCRMMQ